MTARSRSAGGPSPATGSRWSDPIGSGLTRLLLLMPLLGAACLTLTAPARATDIFEKVDVVGATWLVYTADPRDEALGGAYGALADGVAGVHANPAGLAFSPRCEYVDQRFLMPETEIAGDLWLNFFGMSTRLASYGTVAIWRSEFELEPKLRTGPTHPDGDGRFFEMGDGMWGLSYGYPASVHWAFGATYKRVKSTLNDISTSGNGWDAGVIYGNRFQLRDLAFEVGAAGGMRNHGSLAPYIDEMDQRLLLPRTWYTSAAFTASAPRRLTMTLVGEWSYRDRSSRWNRAGGVELEIADCAAFRVGADPADGAVNSHRWGCGGALRWGDLWGVGIDFSRTDLGVLGAHTDRFMLSLQMLDVRRGLDLRQFGER